MARRIIDLLELVGGDAEEEVSLAVDRWKERIRDGVRSMTGFRLTEPSGKRKQTVVPLIVVPGLPALLQELVESRLPDDDMWAIELIGAWRHRIQDLARASKTFPVLIDELEKLESWAAKARRYRGILEELDLMASELQRQAQLAQLTQKLMSIEEDILGAYFYSERAGLFGSEPYKTRIELYWLVIGSLARLIGTSVEGLTVVVLCHEFAHAFSHVGKDIDGKTWRSSFASAHKYTKEGVAQFYTGRVMKKLAEQGYPELLAAYETLLQHQQGPYKCHLEWAEYSPEVMREALLQARRSPKSWEFEIFTTALSTSAGALS